MPHYDLFAMARRHYFHLDRHAVFSPAPRLLMRHYAMQPRAMPCCFAAALYAADDAAFFAVSPFSLAATL